MSNVFEAQVPEGKYQITMLLGGETTDTDIFKFRLEGEEYTVKADQLSVPSQYPDESVIVIPGSYKIFTKEVLIRDGHLTLESVSPEYAPKLNTLRIQQLSTGQNLRDNDHFEFIRGFYIGDNIFEFWEISTLVKPISGQKAVIYSDGVSSEYPFVPNKRFLFSTSATSPLSNPNGRLSEGEASWWLEGSDPFLLFGSALGAHHCTQIKLTAYCLIQNS